MILKQNQDQLEAMEKQLNQIKTNVQGSNRPEKAKKGDQEPSGNLNAFNLNQTESAKSAQGKSSKVDDGGVFKKPSMVTGGSKKRLNESKSVSKADKPENDSSKSDLNGSKSSNQKLKEVHVNPKLSSPIKISTIEEPIDLIN